MQMIGNVWSSVRRRTGRLERALLVGALATVVAVPIAVADPQGSANLQTAPASSTLAVAVSATVTVDGRTLTIQSGINAAGPVTITVAGHTVTLSSPDGLELGPAIVIAGLPAGPVTLTGTPLGRSAFGPLQLVDGKAPATNGSPIIVQASVGPGGVIPIPTSLRGVPLLSLSITLSAGVAGALGPGNAPAPAQQPAGAPIVAAPGQLPLALPHTGAGGSEQ